MGWFKVNAFVDTTVWRKMRAFLFRSPASQIQQKAVYIEERRIELTNIHTHDAVIASNRSPADKCKLKLFFSKQNASIKLHAETETITKQNTLSKH
jgi:hypothetical protein